MDAERGDHCICDGTFNSPNPDCPFHGVDPPVPEPAVCGDVTWCGLPAGHEPSGWERSIRPDYNTALLDGHRVTADGVYSIPSPQYHSDPTVTGSLSTTGAKLLVGRKAAPAKFKHYRENGRPDRESFDVGRAAHREVLGAGGDYEIIPADICAKNGDWSTTEAKDAVAKARAAGKTPIKPKTLQLVQDMAGAIAQNQDAADLLAAPGKREPAVFWTDPASGVVCRTMLDTLPDRRGDEPFILVDYKSTEDAHPDACRRSMWDYGYHRQAAWCMDIAEGLGLCAPGQSRFAFISQEKTAPYLVTVWFPDPVALLVADFRNKQARATYAECTRTGVWPGYTLAPVRLALPPYAERDELQEMS